MSHVPSTVIVILTKKFSNTSELFAFSKGNGCFVPKRDLEMLSYAYPLGFALFHFHYSYGVITWFRFWDN